VWKYFTTWQVGGIKKMEMKFFLAYLPTAMPVIIFFVVMGLLCFLKLFKRSRRSPLTRELLRGPGQSLRTKIENLNMDIASYLAILFITPIMFFSTYLSQIYFGAAKENNLTMCIYIFAAFVLMGFCLLKLWRLLKERTNYQLGLDCEIAVGQELNQLMLQGCRIFHDFPAEESKKKFNIDHIVVSRRGIFAVETKGRAKAVDKETVIYDGQTLRFPKWTENKPIEQAKRNAKWLSKWLSNAIGENVSVRPVLALPGWYVYPKGSSGDVFVFNPKKPQLLIDILGKDSLSEIIVERISFQLEQKCRDVEPIAFKR